MKLEELRDLIVETLGCDAEQVTPEASLTADLKADSPVPGGAGDGPEEATGLSIDDGDMKSLQTVGDVLDYLQEHQN